MRASAASVEKAATQGLTLKYVGQFDEIGVLLIRPFPELRPTALKGELKRTERRFMAPHEDDLQVPPLDHRVGLEKHLQEQITLECTSSARMGHYGFQVKRQSEPTLIGLV